MFKHPEGTKAWLGEVALFDPKLARALLCPDLTGKLTLPGRILDGLGWEIININGCFEGGEVGEPVEATVDGFQGGDIWIREIKFTVRRPNAFKGNIFKAQSDYFNMLNPNINFTLNIKSYCDYLISPTPTPLESIEQVFSCVCPQGLILNFGAQIVARFYNCREFAEDEIPTQVVITMHGIRLRTAYDCLFSDAIAALKSVGVYSDILCEPPDEE